MTLSFDHLDVSSKKVLMPYKPPGPPPKTRKHRYAFTVLRPANGTDGILHPSKPEDRMHWGYSGVRTGSQNWAKENGLNEVAANFIYTQNEVHQGDVHSRASSKCRV